MAIGQEVPRSNQVRGIRHGQFLRLLALQPPPSLDPLGQLHLRVDPADPLVVPDTPLHTSKVQETRAKTPRLVYIRQPDKQVDDQSFSSSRFGP
jgi:hypothetical protein